MTCIVGIGDGKNVWIGGDSAASIGYNVYTLAPEKVFARGDLLVGGTGSMRMLQLVRYNLDIPKHDAGSGIAWMVKRFIPVVRACFRDHGYIEEENKRESGGTFLVGLNGKIYLVASDFQVSLGQNNIAVTGSGDEVALGALYATQGKSPKKRIQIALEAAAHINAYVAPPFVILKR
jgi:ATP-dependent protease HslVU (ClpYQ) peptidase subunit